MKNNIYKFSAIVLAGLSVTAGLTTNQPAQAASNFKRTKTTKISKKNFYSTSKTGKTYKFVGSTKKFHFKANHALKNYKHTTWVASAKTNVTKHGKKYTYYSVKNTKNGATGWVAASYLKSGKDFMMSSAKNTSKSNKVMKKSGKVYQLKGNNNHVSFNNGKSLSAKMTYVASQKRTVYKSGKAYTYYYVTSKDNQTRGWVWSGFVKAGSYKAPTTSGTTTKPSNGNNTSTNTNTNINTNNNSSSNGSSSSATTGKEAYNESAVVNDAVTILNQYRAKKGIAPVTLNAGMQQLATARGPQLNEEYDHYYKGEDAGNALAKKLGVYDEYATEDLISVSSHDTNYATAKDFIEGFQVDDHWGDLMNPSFSGVGIALVEISNEPGNYYVAVEFAF